MYDILHVYVRFIIRNYFTVSKYLSYYLTQVALNNFPTVNRLDSTVKGHDPVSYGFPTMANDFPINHSTQENSHPVHKLPAHHPSVTPCVHFMYANVRSLLNKITLLQYYITSYDLHVICLTETWLSTDIPDALFTPAGYTSLRCDRKNSPGGGSVIIVKNELCPSPFTFDFLYLTEAVACIIELPDLHLKLAIVCIYRPPSYDVNSFDECNAIIKKTMAFNYNHVIIAGDFNMPSINWTNSSYPPKYHSFMTVIDDHFLTQHIMDVTRPASKTTSDLLFTSVGTPISD